MFGKTALVISCSIVYMDARVKSYIKTLTQNGYHVFVISLKEHSGDHLRSQEDDYINYRIATRYIGSSLLQYIFYYLTFFIKAFVVTFCLSLTRKINLVHYNNLPNFPVFSAILPKLLGAKIILDNHDLITIMFASKFTEKPKRKFLHTILMKEQNLSMKFAHKIITADHNQKDYLIAAGVPPQKISVILNVANETWFKSKKINRKDHEFRLIYHGTVSERLGLDLAIKAVNIIKKDIPNIKFFLIGKGDFLNYCESLVDKYKLANHVLLSKCFYPVEELTDIINKMDIGIIPNRKTDATDNFMLPVKLLEYVYMQIPVIAPRLKIIERYFDDTMIKFFEPGDVKDLARCIIALYQNPSERKELVINANRFIVKYNWRAQKKKYLNIISSSI